MNPFEEEIAGKILKYLEQNPDAMDTDKGIAEWWLAAGLKQVRAALLSLVKQKILQTNVINGQVDYLLDSRNGD